MTINLKKFLDATSAAEAKVQNVATQINDLMEADKLDEALKLKPSLETAKAEAKAANELYVAMKIESSGDGDPAARFVPTGGNREPHEVTEMRASKEYSNAFWDAFKRGVTPKSVKNGQHSGEKYGILMNSISETGGSPVGEDGGFLNPVDFDNKIIELMREYIDLGEYVNREPVIAYSGWRVVEQFAAALPLTTMTELAVLADGSEGESPKFDKVDYTLIDYGDFLRVSNDQMADTPVKLMAYLAKWFAKKLVLTHNALILAKINAISPTFAITDNTTTFSKIKTVLNKTLDPAFSASAGVFTNQSGLDILDSLVDGTGRPLLQPDPTNATRLTIKGRPVVYLSDAHWANLTAAVRSRIAIGDLKAFNTLFEREMFEFASTNTGGSAWRSNSTEVRGIARMDCENVDTGACALLTVVV